LRGAAARHWDGMPQKSKQKCPVLGDLAVPHTIHAVYEEDLDEFLEELGLTEPLTQGRLSCLACQKTVTRETLGCIFPLDGEIAACCDGPACLEQLPEEVLS